MAAVNKKIKILIIQTNPSLGIKSGLFAAASEEHAFLKNTADCNIDYKWLQKYEKDDNTSNYSLEKEFFEELTALYRAWKNIDTLNNPDYIGLMRAKTFFDFKNYAQETNLSHLNKNSYYNREFFENLLSVYDGVVAKGVEITKLYEDLKLKNSKESAENIYNFYLNFLEKYPELRYSAYYFRNNGLLHNKNMFILRKRESMEYCDILFGIFDMIFSEDNFDTLPENFNIISESISSLIFDYLKLDKNIGILEAPLLEIQQRSTLNSFFRNIFKRH